MSQRCPICKTRLWTDPFLTAGRLRCPRCGAVFRPTVPWVYFRILLFVAIILLLTIIIYFSERNVWILLFLLGVGIFFWFLPRFIDLQHIRGDLTVPEGPISSSQLKLNLDDQAWKVKREGLEEQSKFKLFVYFLLALILVLMAIASVLQR